MAEYMEHAGKEATPKSILVVLEKLIENSDIEKLAAILKNHEAISKGQYKKVYDAFKKENYSTARQRIVNAMVEKGFKNLEVVLRDEGFPADSETKQLLSYIIMADGDDSLGFMLQNWDPLVEILATVEDMLGMGADWINKDTTPRVKNILITARLALLQGDEDKKLVLAAVKDVINYQMPANVSDQVENQTHEKKRSAAEAELSKPELEKSEVKRPNCNLKRSQDEHDLADAKKQKKDGDLRDTETKVQSDEVKHSSENESDSSSSSDEDLEEKSANQNEADEVEHSSENDISESDSSSSSDEELEEKSANKNGAGDAETGQEKSTGDGDALNTEGISTAVGTTTASGKKVMAEGKPADKLGILETLKKNYGDVDEQEEEKDENNSSARRWTKVKPRKKRKKKKNPPRKQKAPDKSGESAAENMSSNADESSSNIRTEKDDQKAEYGPVTRSMTSSNVGTATSDAKHDDELQKSLFSVLRSDFSPNVIEDGECILEIRAVVSDSQSFPEHAVLYMGYGMQSWNVVRMDFNKRKKFYFTYVLCGSELRGMLQFKFCYKQEDKEKGFIYEKLPGDGYAIWNRVFDLHDVKTTRVVIANACLFQYTNTWGEDCCAQMENFLPTPEVISTGTGNEDDTSPLTDIFCWINCVENGWHLGPRVYRRFVKPAPYVFERVLTKWLANLHKQMSGNQNDSLKLVMIGLAIAVSFSHEKHKILSSDLLHLLFKTLHIAALDDVGCKELHDILKKEHQTASDQGLTIPSYQEAMLWLYIHIPDKPNLDWILTLPLYWLMVHGEVKKEVLKPAPNSKLVYARASLPPITESLPGFARDFSWHKVWRAIHKGGESNKILEMAPSIFSNFEHHPWLIGTYLFMLNSEEFLTLILDRKEKDIAPIFLIDSALVKFLEGCDVRRFQNWTAERISLVDSYFKNRLDAAIELSSGLSLSSGQRCENLTNCETLLDVVIRYLKPANRDPPRSPEDVLWCLDVIIMKTTFWIAVLDVQDRESLKSKLVELLRIVTTGIYKRVVSKLQVEFWGKLLGFEWNLPAFSEQWREEIVREIKNAINNICLTKSSERFLDFYVEDLGGIAMQEDVEKCFNDKAYECTELLLKQPRQKLQFFHKMKGRVMSFLRMPSDSPKPRFILVFEKLFMKEYKKVKSRCSLDTTTALLFLCSWSFSTQFFELFGLEWLQSFSPETRATIERVSSDFKAVVASLLDGKIIVEHLTIMQAHYENFFLIWAVLTADGSESGSSRVDADPKNHVKEAVDRFFSYLKTFKQTKAAVESFMQVCCYTDYEPSSEELHSKVKTDIKHMKVSDLTVLSSENGPTSVGFFGITLAQLEEFQQMSFIKDGKGVFQEMFQKASNGIKQEDENAGAKLSWTHLLEVWGGVKAAIFTLVENIDEGTVTMGDVIRRFNILKGVEKDIKCDVDLFYDFYSKFKQEDGTTKRVSRKKCKRKKQIFNSFQLQRADEAVDILLQLKDLLKLEGDFTIITDRKEMIEKQETTELQTVPENLMIPQICDLNSEKLEILKQFMAAGEVISWLQEKMKDMNEVKVMCDLAMISAGEDAREVDRVSFLLSAVMGFAPLIFWTESERKESGSPKLLERCGRVWENAEKNERLVDRWIETEHQLHWFKDVEKFYGSVEKSSLTRAQQINERGIYRIFWRDETETTCLKNSISLVIPKKIATDSDQHMNLEELIELQSKLMLIAGEAEKGREDVNLFVNVLTSVQKLAQVYVQLLTSGCMLFSEWEATISCCGSASIAGNIRIGINFTEDSRPISGFGSHKDVDGLTEILQATHQKWSEYVTSKRIEFYHLNEFSIRQIMYLCRELSSIEEGQEIPDQVCTLLSFVNKAFTVEELWTSLEKAKDALQFNCEPMETEIEERGREEEGQAMMIEDTEVQDETRMKIKAVRSLLSENSGIQDNVAKAAVQAEGYGDLAACSVWILLHQFNENLIEELAAVFDSDCDFAADKEELEVDHLILSNKSENTLNDRISKLHDNINEYENFLLPVKSICSGYLDETVVMNLQNHLSIGLLGQFLDIFSEERRIIRRLPAGLHQGRPNLMVCAEEEILPTVLSIYMHDMDQPLPSRSDVLVCSDETSSDEVERFMRRAMTKCDNKGQLLYAIAFANKLNYSTSSAFEDIFNNLLKSKKLDDKYQLVILLSNQQHYLATCFEKYLVDGKWNQTTDNIQLYLKRQLKVEELDESAASVTEGNYMVKVVTSTRSGVGKSLYVQRLKEQLMETDIESSNVTIRMLENKLNLDYIIEKLQPMEEETKNEDALLVHVDLTPAVQNGIEAFVFNLFILGSIQGSDGRIWKTHPNHLYAVEMTDFGSTGQKRFSDRYILNLLPSVTCYVPARVLHANALNLPEEWRGMDQEEFQSETFQRPFQYLSRYEKKADLDAFAYQQPEGTENECIDVLLRHCCIEDPSWAQLCHFCSFLNVQLKNCEKSVFCTNPHIKQELAGLKDFAVRFMIRMAQDFATPSLEIADKSMKDSSSTQAANRRAFQQHQIRRRWEESSHPYVFFNDDGQTMTFINVKINNEGVLLGQNENERITTPQLVAALQRQGFNLAKDFDSYSRQDKLRFLRQVLGVAEDFDPDPTYELTTDNVLKMLAIYMRFKCQIPVIIMGETGCGKTRLVEFMAKLKAGPKTEGNDDAMEEENVTGTRVKSTNMITLKIHGGITVENIHKSVEEAKKKELENRGSHDFTVLFYDEANTTEAIYAIKEVMCDGSINGESFRDSKLQIVAACNPYKKLSDVAIQKLEDSGLGYRIRTSKTAHLFGNIPVRSLVYRVVALPPSMQPFVWDFGQLSNEAENIYIQQMTRKLAVKLALSQATMVQINNVLSSCQRYMRSRRDECRYVSLRDVERSMIAYEWFYKKIDVIKKTRKNMDKPHDPTIDDEVWALIQTVGVCYHASLDDREHFRKQLAECFNMAEAGIKTELEQCQRVFLRNVKVGENIATNQALRENVFMMAVCADMRIPLFLIGKPGSSKSLAKTIVTGSMQGQASHAPFYRDLKQIHILSYQCSALTDAEGIERVFNQCIQLQKKQNPEAYTAVVVLDEIGLAEDSPNMPLKVLHPLLERRSTDLTTVDHPDAERVGFIGISNWALDPAKMNRGIFLTRNKPTKKDLIKTGKELVQPRGLWELNVDVFEKLTTTYIKMYSEQNVEFFGLRDYYSLMKMICRLCNRPTPHKETVDFEDAIYSILRNFSGKDQEVIERFKSEVCELPQYGGYSDIPAIPIQRMIKDNLSEDDSRFLLLLANQFSVVSLLESCIEGFTEGAQVVFGSSFPGDHSYTEICRNINKIKVCMETGRTVILLNMANIHESLYDALNQHYVTFAGQNYVDLGLGGHRVKCRIAKDFRLIVIEKKDVVFREYPIPLINRLEKHHFNSESLLNERQRSSSKELKEWAKGFSPMHSCFTSHHAFIGFHDDTASSIVLTAAREELGEYKTVLLQSCAMDAILRLPDSRLHEKEVEDLQNLYLHEQQHDGLADVIKNEIRKKNHFAVLEITSFSGILSKKDVSKLELDLNLSKGCIWLLTLEQFQTQQEYCDRLDQFFKLCKRQADVARVLLVQCAQAQSHGSLIACARHCLKNKIREAKDITSKTGSKMDVTVALLLSTEREGVGGTKMDSLTLQHTQETKIVYVDELRPTDGYIAPASNFLGKSLHHVFELGKQELENEGSFNSLVSIRSLLIDCVCEAVAKVKGQHGNNNRYLERVEILMRLCKDDGIAGDNFRKILLEKIVAVYSKKENDEQMNWILKRANNRESLQEGGTFRKTLWLCLKGHLSRFMALVISIIDRCGNLDMIAKGDEAPWVLNMWLGIFQQIEIQPQDLVSPEFIIARSKNQKHCKLPFSFLIIDFLESQWKALESQRTPDAQESLARLFHEFKLKRVVTDALDFAKKLVMENFAADLIGIMYKSGTENEKELKLTEEVLFDLSMNNFAMARRKEYFQKGDGIAVIFMTFKSISKKLEKFSEVLQGCPEILKDSDSWTEKQDKSSDFILHILAFKDVLKLLKEKAEHLEEAAGCIEWIDLARKVKQMYDSVTSVILEEVDLNERDSAAANVRGDEVDLKLNESVINARVEKGDLKIIQDSWILFSLLDLLLLQLLPPAHSSGQLFRRFVKVIAPQAKLFWRGSERADPRSYDFMKIVLNVLKRCLQDVELQVLIGWQDSTCRNCKKKIKNPTFLPCNHYICGRCTDIVLTNFEARRPRCPVCDAEIPETFTSNPATVNDESAKILRKTKSNCTSFFLEYLQQFCFKRNQCIRGRMERHVKHILKDLIVQDEDSDQAELDSTGLNLNISTKSCILRILLAYDQKLVTEEMDRWLQNLDVDTKKLLVTVVLKCMEQKLLMDSLRYEENKERLTRFWEKVLGSAWMKLLRDGNPQLDMETLQNLAEVRCALGYFASVIEENLKNMKYPDGAQMQIDEFSKICTDLLTSEAMFPAVKEFVIKYGCKKFGRQWLFQLALRDDLRILIPLHLRQAAEDSDTDHWVLFGQQYIDIKAELYQSEPEEYRQVVEAILNGAREDVVARMLAIASWCDKKRQAVKDDMFAILNQHCGNRNELLRKFLAQNQRKMKNIFESNLATKQQVQALYQLLILVIAAAESQNDIMKGFYSILTNPQSVGTLFLPAMSEDMIFSTPLDYRVDSQGKNSMYACPEGHLYSIGDCTMPSVTSNCPVCKRQIGGSRYQSAPGNRKIEKFPQSQAGYIMVEDGAVSTGADRMSPQSAAVVQFVLHSCLLAATLSHERVILGVVQCENATKAQKFLIERLQNNLTQLSQSLARNEDDTVIILHRILLDIADKAPKTYQENWSTLDARKEWEKVFKRDFISPVFQNLDGVVGNGQAAMRQAEETGTALLSRMINEIEDHDLPEDGVSWEHPALWHILEHPSSAHLLQLLEDGMDTYGEVLHIIIKMPDLHCVKYLENILVLQSTLIERYQYMIDMNEADKKTLEDHVENGGHKEEDAIKRYIKAWNHVYPKLRGSALENLHGYFTELSMESPISMVLPSTRGRGQCAKLLAEYLIDVQNRFLTSCIMVIKPAQTIAEEDVPQLTHTDYVCVDKRRDLLNLINMHTSYLIQTDENGRHHHVSYNVEALEKQVREKFVMSKKQIKKITLPLMKYQDVGIGSDWQKVNLNIQQEPLTAKLSQDIDRVVEISHSSDVCEGVRTLSNAISILAMIKTDSKKTLIEFLEKDLKLPSRRTQIIPRSAQICQVLSLYQRLSWHKAVIFIQQGLDPYKEALPSIESDRITEGLLKRTEEALRHTDIAMLQQRINEILIADIGVENGDWSLTEDVFPNVQFVDKTEDDSWFSKLPEELCVKHISHLFALTVNFNADRNVD